MFADKVLKDLFNPTIISVGTNNYFGHKKVGDFDFASSNSLWRASLDTIDFMPLASANYSGGIIITDWYSSNTASSESIKITIRFLTNEIVSNALDIKVFYKKCSSGEKCKIIEKSENIKKELSKKIEKNKTKAGVFIFTAKKVPAITPNRIKIPNDFTILKSTASYSMCVLVEIMDVGIIIAKDVPTDKCILVTISKSKTVNA
mgnify:CR=1 FL=1